MDCPVIKYGLLNTIMISSYFADLFVTCENLDILFKISYFIKF